MGLTIYYRAKVKTHADRARELVRLWHEQVKALPFDDVSPILEYDPPDGRYAFERVDDDPVMRQIKPGDVYLDRKRDDGRTESVRVPALHVVCFHANLEGSETASFGLASHPPVVVHREDVVIENGPDDETHHLNAGDPFEVPTKLRGWYSWSGFCKTQYAGNPKLGGPANFVRSHKAVFHAMDAAKSLGLKTFIRDDANFYRGRNEKKLVAELARWDGMIAGFVGAVSDAVGDAEVVAPIKDRPDFEHIEARGMTAPAKKRRATRRNKPDA